MIKTGAEVGLKIKTLHVHSLKLQDAHMVQRFCFKRTSSPFGQNTPKSPPTPPLLCKNHSLNLKFLFFLVKLIFSIQSFYVYILSGFMDIKETFLC